ncbi:MAG: GyrI-like domain-containing protein [Acidimicrobiia bacterium]
MSNEVQIEHVAALPIVAIRKHTTRNDIGMNIGAALGELIGALAGQGLSASGAPFVVYHAVIEDDVAGDIEVCLPVDSHVDPVGDVYSRALEGGAMATAIHKGPYPELRATYQELMAWIPEHGYEIAGPPREFYLNDPRTVAPEGLLTRVEFPSVAKTG